MLDVNDLVEGVTKVRVLSQPRFVEQPVGSVGTFIEYMEDFKFLLGVSFGDDQIGGGGGDKGLYWFEAEDLETVTCTSGSNKHSDQSEDLIIYKSRWDEIIENLEGGSNGVAGMTDEEAEIVKSVLKNNVPFSVISDPVIIDPIIEKEEQTHLDATHVGDTYNAALYYKSELLKKWFWWNEYDMWKECKFSYEDGEGFFPITISKQG